MINEKRTHEIFGYFSSELSRFSSKPVIATCEQCGQDRQVKKCVGQKSLICIGCQRINQARKIARVNRFGRKHSEKTKMKMRESALRLNRVGERSPAFGIKRTKEHRRIIANANKTRVWSTASRAKLSAIHKGKTISSSTKALWSKQRTGKNNHRYGKPAAHGKGMWYIGKDGKRIWLRSSWECKTAAYLDARGWTWEYEPRSFPVVFSHLKRSKIGTYRPDFRVMVNGLEEFWEIKGYWRDDAQQKFDAFVQQYPHQTIKLLMKKDLKQMGIL
jgi:hypothetical protein